MKLLTGIMLVALPVLLTAFPAFAASPYAGNASKAVQWLSLNQNGDGDRKSVV